MKRFMIFTSERWHGISYESDTDTLQDAMKRAKELISKKGERADYVEIFDTKLDAKCVVHIVIDFISKSDFVSDRYL